MDPRNLGLSFLYRQYDVHKPDAGIVYHEIKNTTNIIDHILEGKEMKKVNYF